MGGQGSAGKNKHKLSAHGHFAAAARLLAVRLQEAGGLPGAIVLRRGWLSRGILCWEGVPYSAGGGGRMHQDVTENGVQQRASEAHNSQSAGQGPERQTREREGIKEEHQDLLAELPLDPESCGEEMTKAME